MEKHSEYVDYEDRNASFATWPERLSHLKKTLAAAGLFYTGNLDETICFQCGGELKDWEWGDDPWEKHAEYHENCSYVRKIKGTDWMNKTIERMRNTKLIPKHSEYVDYEDRYASFATWPEGLSHLKKTLAAAGLFYTGNLDETICFQCGAGLEKWESGDDPWEEHAKRHQNCSYVRRAKGSFWVNQIIERMRNPKLIPEHPEYIDYDDRYASFDTWPEALSHLKETLAAAGLYYTGNRDETICFQCGSGLEEWESGDDPWEEHAKRHVNCSYVRSAKGSDWVNQIIERMRNPKLETVESSTNDKLDEQFKEAENTGAASGSSQNPTGSQNTVIESTGFSVTSAEGSNEEQSIATTFNKKQVRVGIELCKLCGIRKLEIMFLPCAHIVACAKCVRNIAIDGVQLVCNFCDKAVELSVPVCLSRGPFKIMMPKMSKRKRQFCLLSLVHVYTG